jgi:choline monooxygenase
MDTHRDLHPTQPAAAAPRQLLPIEAYTSDEWFRREQKTLFAKSWLFAGMAEDLPENGSYRVLDAAGASLILLRDHQGTLRAFHNACRHRGARLLEGEGKLRRRLTCFYHSWTYDLDGSLAAVTFEKDQFVGLDKTCLGLFRAAVGTWKNLVFVNPDPEAQPFEEWLGDVPRQMVHVPGQTSAFEPEHLVEVSNILYRVEANWKVIVENFIDGYHLPLLHPVSLGDGDFMPQRWARSGRHIVFYRPLKAGVLHDKQPLPLMTGVPASFGAAYYWLFPNVAIYETATSWSTFHVMPLSAGVSLVHSRTRAMPEALERPPMPAAAADAGLPRHVVRAAGPYAGIRARSSTEHPLKSNSVMIEDIYACEAVQKGMSSPACRIGPLSRWEATLPFFQQHVLDALG